MINKNTDPKLHEFWEKKLSVNYDVEYERYKKLCGLPYNKKTVDKNYPDEQEQDLLIYDVWYKSVIKSINRLTYDEKQEYFRYLEQKTRENEDRFTLAQTILAPFMFFFVSFMLSMLNDFMGEVYGVARSFGSLLIGCIVLSLYTFKELLGTKEAANRKYFYQDMKEILDNEIKGT